VQKAMKVNLGCGPKAVKGWVNLDKTWKVYLTRFPFLKIPLRFLSAMGLVNRLNSDEEIPAELGVKRHDVAKGLPFKDNEADYIYSSHMLEHLSRSKADFVLKECYRVLKSGGVLRLVVPDLYLLIEEYIKGKQTGEATSADRFIENLNLSDTKKSKRLINRILSQGHQWIYDFDSLAYRLSSIGFSEVNKCTPGQGEVPDLQQLDEGELHPDSFYLEARK